MYSLLFCDYGETWRRPFPSVEAAVNEARRYLPAFCDYFVYELTEHGRYQVVCSVLPADFPFGFFSDLPF